MRLSQTRRSPKKVGRPAASAARALRESNQFQSNLTRAAPANVKPVGVQKRSASLASSSRAPVALKRASSALSDAGAPKRGPAPRAPSSRSSTESMVSDGDVTSELAASLEDNEKLTGEVERLNTARSQWEERVAEQAAQLTQLQESVEAARRELVAQAAAAASREAALAAEAAATAEAKAQAEAECERAAAEAAVQAARAQAAEASLACTEASLCELASRAAAQEELRRHMHETIQSLRGNIRVFCRLRPAGDEPGCVRVPSGQVEDTVLELLPPEPLKPGDRSGTAQRFQFDHVFGSGTTQPDVFLEVSQLAQSALDGHNVAIFAYGQTGSGKTFTMEGAPGLPGVTPRAVERLFSHAEELAALGSRFTFEVSCLEIYNEEVRDLLAPPAKGADPAKLRLQDLGGTVAVAGLSAAPVASAAEVAPLLAAAQGARSTAATKMNDRSSRSHYVLRLRIKRQEADTPARESDLYLVDLAGSERVKESGVSGDQLAEAKAINKSLSSLGDVISALASGAKHVPFRNSKLTHLMQNALSGSSKTLMFVNVSPNPRHYHETLSSLRFAQKVNGCLTSNKRGLPGK